MNNALYFVSFVMPVFSLWPGVKAQEKGLVAYLKFDEGEGSVVCDASGNGHDGSVRDARWVPGKVKQALNFEQGGFVEVPDHPGLRLQKDFTITAWINKTRASKKGSSMGIVSKSSPDGWDYDLFMSTSRLEHPAFYSDAFQAPDGDIEIISAIPVKPNEWHHIAVTRMDDIATLYLDGVVTGTAILPEDLVSSSNNLFIGHDHDGGFKGSIDEVRIYNRALAIQEISMGINIRILCIATGITVLPWPGTNTSILNLGTSIRSGKIFIL